MWALILANTRTNTRLFSAIKRLHGSLSHRVWTMRRSLAPEQSAQSVRQILTATERDLAKTVSDTNHRRGARHRGIKQVVSGPLWAAPLPT